MKIIIAIISIALLVNSAYLFDTIDSVDSIKRNYVTTDYVESKILNDSFRSETTARIIELEWNTNFFVLNIHRDKLAGFLGFDKYNRTRIVFEGYQNGESRWYIKGNCESDNYSCNTYYVKESKDSYYITRK